MTLRLADATFARRDQQRTRLRAGLGERHLATLGVTVCLALAGAGSGVAVHHHPHGFALLVGHHREVERDVASTPGSGATAAVTRLVISLRSGQPATVRAIWTATTPSSSNATRADHAEIDDRTPQLGILHGAEGLDDLLIRGCRHGGSFVEGVLRANYHYADR